MSKIPMMGCTVERRGGRKGTISVSGSYQTQKGNENSLLIICREGSSDRSCRASRGRQIHPLVSAFIVLSGNESVAQWGHDGLWALRFRVKLGILYCNRCSPGDECLEIIRQAHHLCCRTPVILNITTTI